MIPHIAWLVIFNIVINSWMAFVTSMIIIEGLIRLLRIKNHRYLSFLKAIPIIKMPLDLCFIGWSQWAILNHIYPWDCPEGTRTLLMAIGFVHPWAETFAFPFSLKIALSVLDGYSFSIADYLAYFLGKTWLISTVSLFLIVTAVRWIRAVILFWHAYKGRRISLAACYPCYRPINNLYLKKELFLRKITLVVDPHAIGSPYLLGAFKQKIVFPEILLKNLSLQEYEAVIAHELQHAKKKDPLIKGLILFVQELFWWVPMRRLIRSIELEQEIDCDGATRNWVSTVDLASALIKVAKQKICSEPKFGIPLLKPSLLAQRITALNLVVLPVRWKWLRRATVCVGAFLALAILFGKVWEI